MTPTEAAEQRQQSLEKANEKRKLVAATRRRLRNEPGALRQILMDPPAELHGWLIIDIVRLSRQTRSVAGLRHLGQLALRNNVNLMLPLGAASERTRSWVADHATWFWRQSEAS